MFNLTTRQMEEPKTFKEVGSVNQALSENMALARKILDHVQKTVLFSHNYPERSPVCQAETDKDAYQARLKALETVTQEIQTTPSDPQSELSPLLQRAALAEKYSVGNCVEMSAVGLKYAIDTSAVQQVRLYTIDDGNHAFLVIGKGKNAVVCDPWAASCFLFSQVNQHLKDYVERRPRPGSSVGRIVTVVKDFDPEKQFLAQAVVYPGAPRQVSKEESSQPAPRPQQKAAPPRSPIRYQTLLRHKF